MRHTVHELLFSRVVDQAYRAASAFEKPESLQVPPILDLDPVESASSDFKLLDVLMTLLGHTSPDMTMRYVEVALTDLRREFDLARSQPRHLVPQPKTTGASLRAGRDGVIDALLSAQHVLEMFRRALPVGASRTSLARLSNRLTKILAQARKLTTA